jgi:hypothetical protein
MSDEFTGFGSTFKMGNPLVELANIEEFPDLPSFTRDLLDTTNYKTEGGFMTYIGSPLKEGAESNLVMKIALGSASDVKCREAHASGAVQPYEMILPLADGRTYSVTGNLIVRNYVRTNPKADIRMATLSVKWSGIAAEEASEAPAPEEASEAPAP